MPIQDTGTIWNFRMPTQWRRISLSIRSAVSPLAIAHIRFRGLPFSSCTAIPSIFSYRNPGTIIPTDKRFSPIILAVCPTMNVCGAW